MGNETKTEQPPITIRHSTGMMPFGLQGAQFPLLRHEGRWTISGEIGGARLGQRSEINSTYMSDYVFDWTHYDRHLVGTDLTNPTYTFGPGKSTDIYWGAVANSGQGTSQGHQVGAVGAISAKYRMNNSTSLLGWAEFGMQPSGHSGAIAYNPNPQIEQGNLLVVQSRNLYRRTMTYADTFGPEAQTYFGGNRSTQPGAYAMMPPPQMETPIAGVGVGVQQNVLLGETTAASVAPTVKANLFADGKVNANPALHMGLTQKIGRGENVTVGLTGWIEAARAGGMGPAQIAQAVSQAGLAATAKLDQAITTRVNQWGQDAAQGQQTIAADVSSNYIHNFQNFAPEALKGINQAALDQSKEVVLKAGIAAKAEYTSPNGKTKLYAGVAYAPSSRDGFSNIDVGEATPSEFTVQTAKDGVTNVPLVGGTSNIGTSVVDDMQFRVGGSHTIGGNGHRGRNRTPCPK